jgi:dTMP kinase
MAFLVIEGLDGSGKSTQVDLFRGYLEKKNILYKYIHFPRTGTGIFGELISMFLRGDLGKMEDVNPYLVSLIYAADRHDAGADLIEWLGKGRLLLVDRYVMSNIAFQCAKVTQDEKKALREWILHLEYDHYGIPRPDMNIFLDVPFEFTRKKLNHQRSGKERDYLRGKHDIHEADLDFQQKVREVYFEQAAVEKNFSIIPCYDKNNMMLGPSEIFNKILALLDKVNFFENIRF